MKILCQKVILRPAEKKERKLIFDMAMKTEILSFSDSYNNTYEKFIEDYTEDYFSGEFNNICSGVMICIDETPIGFISYGQICFEANGLKQCIMELDIWMNGESKCGKGYGSDAIIGLSDFLYKKHGIKMFIMVPSKKNLRAVKSYEKSGFVKTYKQEKQKILEKIFTIEYLKSLSKNDDYVSENNWFMVKYYV